MRIRVKIHETKTAQKKKPKRQGQEGTPRKPRVHFYDHQPSSSIVGVVDATLAVGDAERISAPLGFGVLNPLPFGVRWGMPFSRYGLCIEFQTPLEANCARAGFALTGVAERLRM